MANSLVRDARYIPDTEIERLILKLVKRHVYPSYTTAHREGLSCDQTRFRTVRERLAASGVVMPHKASVLTARAKAKSVCSQGRWEYSPYNGTRELVKGPKPEPVKTIWEPSWADQSRPEIIQAVRDARAAERRLRG